MRNYKFNADHSNPQDRKIFREFAEEMKFDTKITGRPSTRDSFVIRKIVSPAIMASRVSTTCLSSDSGDVCDRIESLLQEKQAGNNSILFNEENDCDGG